MAPLAGALSSAGPLEAAPPRQRPKLTMKTLFVLGAMNMIDCINVNLLTPYVDIMVSDFLQAAPDDPKVAHTVGLLIGLYSFCEVIFSPLWGMLADRIGRKPTLLIGLAGSVIAPIMFGLGKSLPVVFFARALDGFFCGNMGVTRTYLGEIVDASNEAKGWSFLSVCFSLGLFIGPMLGGELVFPAKLAPQVFAGTIFDTYPFLLPNLTYAIFAAVAWVIGMLFLEETLPRSARQGLCGGARPGMRPRQRTQSWTGSDPSGAPQVMPMDPDNGTSNLGAQPAPPSRCYPPILLQVIVAYCALAGCTTAMTQLFVLIVSFPRDKDGFDFGPAQIGLLQNVAAAGLLITQLFLYPILIRRLGFLRAFMLGWGLYAFAWALFPFYGLFADPDRFHGWRYVPLAIMQVLAAMGGGLCYPTAFAFINRASVGLDRGAVNGWAHSSGALCRAVFPPAMGWLLGLTAQSKSFEGRYVAIHVNLLVGTLAYALSMPGLRRADQLSSDTAKSFRPMLSGAGVSRTSSRVIAPTGSSGREPLVDAH